MTATARRLRPVGRRAGGIHPAIRAARVDLRLQREAFAGSMILTAGALVLAVLSSELLTAYAPLWAALAWQRYGRGDTTAAVTLVASLGISRADRVRGRVLLVGLESAVLVVVTTIGTVIGTFRGDRVSMAPLTDELGGAPGAVATVVAIAVLPVIALALVAMSVGRECTTRRPGWGMFGITLVVYFAALLVAGLGVAAPAAVVQATVPQPWGTVCAVAIYGVTAALALLLLRSRVRSWIRALNTRGEGAP